MFNPIIVLLEASPPNQILLTFHESHFANFPETYVCQWRGFNASFSYSILLYIQIRHYAILVIFTILPFFKVYNVC